ncbi:MAG: hypothetical protein QXR36_03310 [Desulfurococcaceae archaeon]
MLFPNLETSHIMYSAESEPARGWRRIRESPGCSLRRGAHAYTMDAVEVNSAGSLVLSTRSPG